MCVSWKLGPGRDSTFLKYSFLCLAAKGFGGRYNIGDEEGGVRMLIVPARGWPE